jgi:hypothetical protein
MNWITNTLLTMGLTRDSLVWFWGRLTAGAALVATGLVPLDDYMTPGWQKVLTVGAVVVLWLAGRYDSSPLPGAKKDR